MITVGLGALPGGPPAGAARLAGGYYVVIDNPANKIYDNYCVVIVKFQIFYDVI